MTMIDEDRLAEALRGLSAAIEVPSDGPARVLAARERAAQGRAAQGRAAQGRTFGSRRSTSPGRSAPRRRVAVVAVGVALASLAVLMIGLVVSRPSARSSVATSAPAVPNADAGGTASFGSSQDSGTQLPAAGGQASALAPSPSASAAPKLAAPTPGAPASAPALPSPALPTKIIKTGSVDLQVGRGKLSPTVDQLTTLAGGLGGYVANAKTAEGGGAPVGDLTLRVPVEQFETLLGRTRAMGRPTAVSTSGQDVTAAYVDLDARIKVLDDTRTQYLQILSKATAIGDILSVEQQLSSLQTQIEQLQGQQKVLADQTGFATLAVHVSEPGASTGSIPSPPRGLAAAWAHARHSFAHGVEAVVGASGGVLVFLIFAGVVLLAGRLAWPVIRRRVV
ncbi:MAG: DUF4349 domain-containing protein [Actinomycetota bacterium]|nr:DUF4349 domain-containing protein [Actinomycetota bacterium]